jgi:hypothetical protein
VCFGLRNGYMPPAILWVTDCQRGSELEGDLAALRRQLAEAERILPDQETFPDNDRERRLIKRLRSDRAADAAVGPRAGWRRPGKTHESATAGVSEALVRSQPRWRPTACTGPGITALRRRWVERLGHKCTPVN